MTPSIGRSESIHFQLIHLSDRNPCGLHMTPNLHSSIFLHRYRIHGIDFLLPLNSIVPSKAMDPSIYQNQWWSRVQVR